MLLLRIAYIAVFASIFLTMVQTAWYFQDLPDPIASHFDENGNANQFIPKLSMMILHNGLQIGMAAMLIGLAKMLPKLPTSMINTPHKEYWLAENNRADFFQINELVLVSIAAATGLFLLAIFQLVIQSNLANRTLNLPAFVGALVVYLIFVFAVCLVFFLRLKKAATSSSTETNLRREH